VKAEDQYLKSVLWSDDDSMYVGYCPTLFPWAGSVTSRLRKKLIASCARSCVRKWSNCVRLVKKCLLPALDQCGKPYWPEPLRTTARPRLRSSILPPSTGFTSLSGSLGMRAPPRALNGGVSVFLRSAPCLLYRIISKSYKIRLAPLSESDYCIL
jgi:hypothetical protein